MDTSEEYIKVIIVHSTEYFFFLFCILMYLNIAANLYGKQIKSKLENKLYLLMIFICVHLNRLDLHECHVMTLKQSWSISVVSALLLVHSILKHQKFQTDKIKPHSKAQNSLMYM